MVFGIKNELRNREVYEEAARFDPLLVACDKTFKFTPDFIISVGENFNVKPAEPGVKMIISMRVPTGGIYERDG